MKDIYNKIKNTPAEKESNNTEQKAINLEDSSPKNIFYFIFFKNFVFFKSSLRKLTS